MGIGATSLAKGLQSAPLVYTMGLGMFYKAAVKFIELISPISYSPNPHFS